MTPIHPDSPRLNLPRLTLPRLMLAGLVLLLLCGSFLTARAIGLASVQAEAQAAAELRVLALDAILAKQRAVSTILAEDDAVRAALQHGGQARRDLVSQKLERLHRQTQNAVIYLLDRQGTAISASNWDEPVSFAGENYGFRDYFSRAMAEGRATQFALGTVSNRPGLYLSDRVDGPDGPLGVVVVKVEFNAVEAAWAASPGQTFVTDAAGDVVLTSRPGLRFAPLPGIGTDPAQVVVPGVPGWVLLLALPQTAALVLAGQAMAGMALLLAAAALWAARLRRHRQRLAEQAAAEARYRGDLEQAVTERTRALSAEMAERQAAEARLARMQGDLVQANKLATLGQVTAGVAHEVNQPLATIRLLAENAEALLPARAKADLRGNLARIVQMTDRIAQITTELRGFARKATGQLAPVSLREVIEASVLLTASRRRAEGARLVLPDLSRDIIVMAEAVRLEQVLVNLIQNAQEALTGQPDPEIRLGVERDGGQVTLTVADNGPGLSSAARAALFTPFASTKPDGLGLGLVIAETIIRDFGGRLVADPDRAGQGAVFRLTLQGAA